MRLLAICTFALVILAVFIDSINGDETTPPNANVTQHGRHKGLNLLHGTNFQNRLKLPQQFNECRTACRTTQTGTLPTVDPQTLRACLRECVQQSKLKIPRPATTG
jgi:hypothetical protein